MTKQTLREQFIAALTAKGESVVKTLTSCGGADDVDNLWPQSAPSWHNKDRLENWVHSQFLKKKITIKDCLAIFLDDWQKKYKEIFGW